MFLSKIARLCGLTTTILLATTNVVFAAEGTWTGWLVDHKCASTQTNSEASLNFAKKHSNQCALMPACRKSGYVVLTDGKWLALDKNGNKLAADLLKTTKVDKGLEVRVEGELTGDQIKVKQLQSLKSSK